MALDPYADSEANFLAWIAGQGAPAATDPLALGPTPTPTTEEVPAGMLPPEPVPAAQNDQWWPSSWLAGGDEAAKAMNAPQTPAVGPEPAGAPPREQNPLAAPQAELDKLPPPMFGPSPTPPPPEPQPDAPGLGTIAAGAARGIALNSDPLRKDERGEFIDPDEASRDARLRAMPEADFQVYKLKQQQEAEEIAKAKALDEAKLNTQRAQANYAAFTKATEHALQERDRLMAESKALANTRIDRRDAFKKQGTGTKLLGVLQAVIGGLVAGRTGGPNQGLQMLLKEADDYAEDMRADLARRSGELQRQQGLVSTSLGQASDNYRLGELARQASYETVLREIDAQRQSYDPKGTAAIRLAETYRGVQAAAAASAQAFAERTQKAAMEQWKTAADIELRKAELDRKLAGDAARAAGGYGSGGGGGGASLGGIDEKAVQTPEGLARLYGITDPSLIPPIPMSIKEFGDFLEKKGKLGVIEKTAHEKGAEGRKVAIERGGFGITDIVDGKPVEFIPKGTPESVEKFRTKFSSSVNLVNLMDQAMSLRNGWSSDVGKSEEWQRLRSIWGAAVLQAKNAGELGVLAGPDMEVIDKWIGTDDPTKMRGVEHAVDQARKNIVDGVRNDLVHRGLSKEAAIQWGVANPYKRKAVAVDGDDAIKLVLKESYDSDFHREIDPSKEELVAKRKEWTAQGRILPSQKAVMDRWFADLRKPNDSKEWKHAHEALTRASKESGTEGVRDYAKKLLSLETDIATTPSRDATWGGGTGLTYQP